MCDYIWPQKAHLQTLLTFISYLEINNLKQPIGYQTKQFQLLFEGYHSIFSILLLYYKMTSDLDT